MFASYANILTLLPTYMESYIEQLTALAVAYAPKVLLALLSLIIGLRVINWIASLVDRAMQRRNLEATVRPFLRSLVEVGLKVMLLLSVAGMFGIETTSFIALFSALAFAVGLALQGSLGHFASGVLLLIFKPYRVGDLVEIGGGQTGHVEEIGVFNTVLRTDDNKLIIVPNGVVTSNIITNISGQGVIRVDMQITVDDQTNIDQARAAIERAAQACPTVLKDRPTDILVQDIAGGITFAVRPWSNSGHYWDTFFFMKEHMAKELGGEHIEGPVNRVVQFQGK